MAVEGDESRAVVEVDAVAGEPEVVPREDDDTVGRRLDRRSLFCAHVDAAVAAASESYRNDPARDFSYKENVFFQKDVGDALTIYNDYYQKLKVGE